MFKLLLYAEFLRSLFLPGVREHRSILSVAGRFFFSAPLVAIFPSTHRGESFLKWTLTCKDINMMTRGIRKIPENLVRLCLLYPPRC